MLKVEDSVSRLCKRLGLWHLPEPALAVAASASVAANAGAGGGAARERRVSHYTLLLALGLITVWAPIGVYLEVAPVRYTSHLSLVLPGAGLSTSVNLTDIGQASSSSNSAYASSALNPAVLYKNMLESYAVIERAARIANVSPTAFEKPVVKLVDETSLIGIDVAGRSAEEAAQRAEALQTALSDELDKLRTDEANRRETSAAASVRGYQQSVESIRAKISALQTQSGLNSAEQYSGIVAASEALRTRVEESEVALRKKEAEVDALSATIGVSPETAALTIRANGDPEIGALADTAAKSAADVAELANLGPRNPKLAEARSRAEGAAAALAARGALATGLSPERFTHEIHLRSTGDLAGMARLVASAAERDGMRAEFRNMSSKLEALRTRVRDLVDTAARLDSLNRDYKVADAVFASALARINSTKSDLYASYPLIQVAEPATLPETPSSPNKLIAAIAGVAATLFLGIGLALASIRQSLIEKLLSRPGDSHD